MLRRLTGIDREIATDFGRAASDAKAVAATAG